jgi:hypothetical protein
MEETGSAQIIFGPGGEILDVDAPANQKLLEQIRETNPLLPVELIKLATFFRAYPTNAPLGNYLLLSALEMMVTHPRLQEHLQAVNNVDGITWEQIEDALDCEKEVPGSRDVDPEDTFACHFFRWVPFSGAGLVIESQTSESSFFVIGVSPSPASLPFS